MKLERTKVKEPLGTNHTIAKKLLEGHKYPWEVLGDIDGFIEGLGASLPENRYKKIGKSIQIHKTTQMAPITTMGGPATIEPKAQTRSDAFLRGGVIPGQHVVVGNSRETKNSIIFGEAQAPHFNYVGDSILGYKVHMRTGVVTSDMKADKGLIRIYAKDGDVGTGRKKFGAILGDHAEIGCDSILNPGAVIGRNSNVCPLSSICGYVLSDPIYKSRDGITVKEVREVEAEQEAPGAPEKGKGGLKVIK